MQVSELKLARPDDPTPWDSTDGTANVLPPADMQLLDSLSHAVTRVADAILPAVISIETESSSDGEGSCATGIVLTPDGYAITNSHVVAGAARIGALDHEGNPIELSVIGVDPATDLAALRLNASALPHAHLGSSNEASVGQIVLAIGNPLGFSGTVSLGVVSSAARSLRTAQGALIESVIQHTAPINPGSSGGPLVDAHGRVIGVNTALLPGAHGMAFAIASDVAKRIFTQLMTRGYVRRGRMGVAGRRHMLSFDQVERFRLKSYQAIEATAVRDHGPADEAGIQEGDLIVSINEQPVQGLDDVQRWLTDWAVGEALILEIIRDNELIEIAVVPVEAVGAGECGHEGNSRQ